jgi:hypothetical protein
MDPDVLLAEIGSLSRIPSADQPGDWSKLATKVNQLCDYLSMGGKVPQHWQTAAWKPYAHERANGHAGADLIPAGRQDTLDEATATAGDLIEWMRGQERTGRLDVHQQSALTITLAIIGEHWHGHPAGPHHGGDT